MIEHWIFSFIIAIETYAVIKLIKLTNKMETELREAYVRHRHDDYKIHQMIIKNKRLEEELRLKNEAIQSGLHDDPANSY